MRRSYTISDLLFNHFLETERKNMNPKSPPAGRQPSKVIAVHVNYRSRAAERGSVPDSPSYFLKPPSSLAADGDPVARPRGSELLNFEGEIALVIGTVARRVSEAEAAGHIAGFAAANDFGLYDLRWADRGSNLMAKGQDGFTPIGPRLVPAEELDPDALTLRTLVNGEVVQEGSSAELIFPFARIVADLSRFCTLEPGDLILTGTPAGSRPVEPGDVVEVEVEGIGKIGNEIVEGPELEPLGAMPRVTPATRAAAGGAAAVALSDAARQALGQVSTATLTVQLKRRGIRNAFIAGLRSTRPGARLFGYARTLRYVPLREDVVAAETGELNAQKRAVESIGPEEVLVMDARGEEGAGTIGDILATRAMRRGCVGIVTDGGIRDSAAIASLEIPTYFRSRHAAVLGLAHYPLETDVPIACGGALVMPGDVLVGDDDGVVVLPAALAEEIAATALEQEEREQFALELVEGGESVRGVYPLGEERMEEYERWRRARAGAPQKTEEKDR
jgi:2-keto-4-pentenoate hydratase/2-oxohepta-3-ene-1,7-dioic acid hydratase in catechol pathway/regulator of RNase E activity RraA